ncbi:hypothetical protein QOT17_014909 [Balamuthia mandrillaris]
MRVKTLGALVGGFLFLMLMLYYLSFGPGQVEKEAMKQSLAEMVREVETLKQTIEQNEIRIQQLNMGMEKEKENRRSIWNKLEQTMESLEQVQYEGTQELQNLRQKMDEQDISLQTNGQRLVELEERMENVSEQLEEDSVRLERHVSALLEEVEGMKDGNMNPSTTRDLDWRNGVLDKVAELQRAVFSMEEEVNDQADKLQLQDERIAQGVEYKFALDALQWEVKRIKDDMAKVLRVVADISTGEGIRVELQEQQLREVMEEDPQVEQQEERLRQEQELEEQEDETQHHNNTIRDLESLALSKKTK